MKLVVFCLFAVCCSSLASTTERPLRKLLEVMSELQAVRKNLKNNDTMLNIPPQNLTGCCGPSALQCFRANLNVKFGITERAPTKEGKLYRSLKMGLTERSLNFICDSTNAQLNCPHCDEHPKGNVTQFFDSLESLFQKAIATRRSME
ncbi:interleukin-21 [Centropristis striata]|uniref:interleukin-21 n=1 Tax=Centropristis striata TaxID=184440 RepID=UPI0027E085EA|nr:interleukin-21 [Centropristis striata]